MSEALDALILDLLESIAPRPRPYLEVIDAWRTSCPRLPVWEEASDRELLELHSPEGGALLVRLTASGRELLARHRGATAAG
jgi:D-3-phosphoglycerate dehydrogenase